MKIVIKNGYQYFSRDDGTFVLVLDTNGDPLPANAREWVETEDAYILYPRMSSTDRLH